MIKRLTTVELPDNLCNTCFEENCKDRINADKMSMVRITNCNMYKPSHITLSDKNESIGKYKEMLLNNTDIESSDIEMAALDKLLTRFWEMGWLDNNLLIPYGKNKLIKTLKILIRERDIQIENKCLPDDIEALNVCIKIFELLIDRK